MTELTTSPSNMNDLLIDGDLNECIFNIAIQNIKPGELIDKKGNSVISSSDLTATHEVATVATVTTTVKGEKNQSITSPITKVKKIYPTLTVKGLKGDDCGYNIIFKNLGDTLGKVKLNFYFPKDIAGSLTNKGWSFQQNAIKIIPDPNSKNNDNTNPTFQRVDNVDGSRNAAMVVFNNKDACQDATFTINIQEKTDDKSDIKKYYIDPRTRRSRT